VKDLAQGVAEDVLGAAKDGGAKVFHREGFILSIVISAVVFSFSSPLLIKKKLKSLKSRYIV